MTDPREILYSLPTLCDPGPATDATPLPAGHCWLEEDAWRQVEFVARTNLAHIRHQLAALTTFKKKHRRDPGWTDVYMRKEHPAPFAAVGLRFTSLPRFSTSGLAIGDGPPWGGAVLGGFALSNGGDWFFYGQRTDDDRVIQLAVSPGHSAASGQFALAVSQLAQTGGLLLVDWYTGTVVDTSSVESVLAWTRRCQ